ncbi:hypothetical protein HK101_003854 [Irineochytrium annulatum]|nr:hypothetical protein HK101_003854 [Irineochytrium annulatum]
MATNDPDRDLRAAAPDKRLVYLDDHCKSSLEDFKVPGVAVAVVLNGRIVYAKGFGVCTFDGSCDIGGSPVATSPQRAIGGGAPELRRQESWFGKTGREAPVDADTPFQLNCAGDGIISLMLGTMVEDSSASLETPVASILPSFTHPIAPFLTATTTVSDLLSHRSGIPSTSTSLMAIIASELPLNMIPSAISAIPADECPEYRNTYCRSSLNTSIASQIASRLQNGQSVEEMLHDRVWSRIGASPRSGVIAEGKEDTSTGITSTARDLARLVCSLLDGTWGCVKSTTFAQLTDPVGVREPLVDAILAEDEVKAYTVGKGGFTNSVYRSRRRIGFGTGSGTVEVTMFPDDNFGVVVMASARSFGKGMRATHLPMSISNVVADFLLGHMPLPWSAKMEKYVLATTESNGISAQTGTLGRSLFMYTGFFVSSIAPAIGFKLTADDTKLYASVVTPGARQSDPAILHPTVTDVFAVSIHNLRPTFRQFDARYATFLFRGGLDGSAEGVTVSVAGNSSGVYFNKAERHPVPSAAKARCLQHPSPESLHLNYGKGDGHYSRGDPDICASEPAPAAAPAESAELIYHDRSSHSRQFRADTDAFPVCPAAVRGYPSETASGNPQGNAEELAKALSGVESSNGADLNALEDEVAGSMSALDELMTDMGIIDKTNKTT